MYIYVWIYRWTEDPHSLVQVTAQEWSGMARPGPDPTALLRLYIKHDRLEDAADLAVSFLSQWERQVSEVPCSRPRVLMMQGASAACCALHASISLLLKSYNERPARIAGVQIEARINWAKVERGNAICHLCHSVNCASAA